MVEAADLCSAELVEIATTNGKSTKVAGYRYLDFAVTPARGFEGGWWITHLPTGTTLVGAEGLFANRNHACDAMVEITTLRNDWTDIPASTLAALREAVTTVQRRHGGGRAPPDAKAKAGALTPRFNGYAEDPSQ